MKFNRLMMALVVMALVVPQFSSVANAQTACAGWSVQMTPMDFETITVSTAAIGFTAAKIRNTTTGYNAAFAFFTAETADGRYRVDGVDPTAAIGHIFAASTSGAGYFVCGQAAVTAFRAIRSGGSDSTVRVTYFRGN